MDTRGEEDINEASCAGGKDHKLVLRILTERLKKAVARGAVAGAAV